MAHIVKLTSEPSQILNYGFRNRSHCDVEIKTQGGWKIYAHSFYLASCSTILKECLEGVRVGALPVIYLPDVRPSVIEGLLQFIYTGEVNIHQMDYADFVSLGKMLKIDYLAERMESGNTNKDQTTNFVEEDPLLSGNDDIQDVDDDTIYDLSDDDDDDASIYSDSNNIIFVPRASTTGAPIIQQEISSDDDKELEKEFRSLRPNKRHQIICKKNIPLFRDRLYHSLSKLYATLDITLHESMKENLILNMSKDMPRWVDCDTKCLYCHKPLKFHCRVHNDGKRFAQWRTGNFQKYHITRHAVDKATKKKATATEIKFEEEEYGDFEMTETSSPSAEPNSELLIETNFNERPKKLPAASLLICEENAQELKQRLIKAVNLTLVRGVSKKLRMNVKPKVSFTLGGNPTEMKARYECCVCKRSISINFKKDNLHFITWYTSSIKRHFSIHK